MAQQNNPWAIPLVLSDFNIVVALLGGFISLFGLVSYLLKENYYLSEARKLTPIDMGQCLDSPCGMSESQVGTRPSRITECHVIP